MLIKLVDHLKKDDPLKRPVRGTVVFNDDPLKLGRIKVNIPSLLESEDTDLLPWIFQKSPSSLGGRADFGSFYVPEIDTEVIVEFPFDNIYCGFYTAVWQSDYTHQSMFDEDYPYCYGFRDDQGTYYKVNRAKGTFEFKHKSGSSYEIDAESLVTIKSSKGLNLRSIDGNTSIYFDLEAGNINVAPKKVFEIGGPLALISAKSTNIITGIMTEVISGSKDSKMVGGRKNIIGGSDTLAVTGNRAVTVAGNLSEMVAGDTSQTYGTKVDQTLAAGDWKTLLILGNREYTLTAGNFKNSLIAGNYENSLTLGNYTNDLTAGNYTNKLLFGDYKTDVTTGNIKESILTGDKTTEVATGNIKEDITTGNKETNITAGDYKINVTAGELNITNSVVKITASKTGDIEVSGPLGKLTMSAAGEVTLTDGTIAKLKLGTGMVGLGTDTCEIVDMLIKVIDALLPTNQPALCMTGVGPSSALLPPAAVSLVAYKALLTAIKGGV